MIAGDPDVTRVRRRTVMLDNGSGRPNADHDANLRERHCRGKEKREKKSQNRFLHRFANLQRFSLPERENCSAGQL